jgi:ABC-type Fe3+-hydroxamate transport system substrate-binding protein
MQADKLLDDLTTLLELEGITPTHPAYVSIEPLLYQAHSPRQILQTIRTIGEALNVENQANDWVENQYERLNILAHKIKFVDPSLRPKVWYITDFEDTNTISPYWEEAIELAGGISLPSIEQVSPLLADHLLIISQLPEVAIWSQLPAWIQEQGLDMSEAIKQNQVTVIPVDAQWPAHGWDIAAQVEHLAEMLYPSFFAFGTPATPWVPFEF